MVLWDGALVDKASTTLAVISCLASLVGASPCCYLAISVSEEGECDFPI